MNMPLPMLFIVIAGFIAVFVLGREILRAPIQYPLPFKGKTLWLDKKGTKAFYNKEYGIVGKPDVIVEAEDGVVAVEYKSRSSQVYTSDIVQLIAATLAARSAGFNITKGLVKTAENFKWVDLSGTNEMLYQKISKYAELAKQAQSGKKGLPASPNYFKCKYCSYAKSCSAKA